MLLCKAAMSRISGGQLNVDCRFDPILSVESTVYQLINLRKRFLKFKAGK